MSETTSPRDDQHVLVTGGAGFIGGNLARRLVDDDRVTRVTVLGRPVDRTPRQPGRGGRRRHPGGAGGGHGAGRGAGDPAGG
jgi:nucleoside-diphosphate-sugar epimerase